MSFLSRNKISGNFSVNGVNIPDPDSFPLTRNTVLLNAERTMDNAKLLAEYGGTAYSVTWKWKWIAEDKFKIINDNIISLTEHNKKVFFNVKTRNVFDSKGAPITFVGYIEDKITVEPVLYREGIGFIYKDISITIIDQGGDK